MLVDNENSHIIEMNWNCVFISEKTCTYNSLKMLKALLIKTRLLAFFDDKGSTFLITNIRL